MVLLRGGLADFAGAYLGFNAPNASVPGYDFASSIREFRDHFLGKPRVMLLTVAAFAGLGWLTVRSSRDSVVIALWLMLCLFGAAVMGRWQGYDMHATHLALVFLATLGVARIDRELGRGVRVLTIAVLVLVTVTSAELSAKYSFAWVRMVSGQWSEKEYHLTQFDGAWLRYSYRSSSAIADYVRARTEPDDAILALENPVVNYLADRRSIGRHTSPRAAWDVTMAATDARAREFHADLVSVAPKYVVIGPPAVTLDRIEGDFPVGRAMTPELIAEIKAFYELDVRCDRYFVFVRRGMAESPMANGARRELCAFIRG